MEDAERYGKAELAEATALLREGEIVAVPTETVYGLAADSANAQAVAEIYRVKGRPDFNPLIVHVPGVDAARRLAEFNDLAARLAGRFWPGPLTLVLPKRPDCPVAPAVTAGLDSIALRCPAHPLMQALLGKSGLTLAAPSANPSGAVSPTSAAHVEAMLGEQIPLILNGGECERGLESTIVAVDGTDYRILRPGPITAAQLAETAGKGPVNDKPGGKIEAPGQLARHYAPHKPLRLDVVEAEPDEYHITFGPLTGHVNLSENGDLAEAAANLFAALHRADASDAKKIAVAPIPNQGIGLAINDRLKRASQPS